MSKIKLKPCPFCGGEVELASWYKCQSYVAGIFCKNEECSSRIPAFRADTEEDAIQQAIIAWNKRAFEPAKGSWLLYEDKDTNAWECSVCHEVQQLMDGTPFWNHWHYCPNCGAKMEEEIKS